MMRQIFNEVLKQRDCTSEAWRRKRIKVIYKEGDVEEAGNYRPFCILPALYNFFSTLLHNRLYPRLDRGQPGRSGRISTLIPNSGSSCNVQVVITEVSGVGNQNVDSDCGLRESLRHEKAQSTVGHRSLISVSNHTTSAN